MSASYVRALTLAALGVLLAGAPAAAQETPDPASWREVPADRLLELDTTKGRILIETAPEFAPNHAARFTNFVRTGFYDGTIFHRVIDDFMVQGGDPDGNGTGGSGTNVDAEFSVQRDASVPVVEIASRGDDRVGFWHGMPVLTDPSAQLAVRASGTVESSITHCAGVMSTARNGAQDPAEDRALWNTGDSQFFMMRYGARADGTPNTFLDRQYTAWGRVVSGLDIVREINIGTVGETPGFEPDSIVSGKVVGDLPEGERPRVFVMREDGPEFQTLLASRTAENGGVTPDVCEIEIPSIVQDP